MEKYIHTFKDANICVLTFNDDLTKCEAKWKHEPHWADIEDEYLKWRNGVADMILNKKLSQKP